MGTTDVETETLWETGGLDDHIDSWKLVGNMVKAPSVGKPAKTHAMLSHKHSRAEVLHISRHCGEHSMGMIAKTHYRLHICNPL